MRLYALALSSISLFQANVTFPSQEEQAVIAKPYSDCLNAAAERQDDGHSDIAVIGKAVSAACKAEFDQMIAVLGQNLSAEDRQTLNASLTAMQIGYATVAVGQVRRRQRGPIDH